jgi:hypothetical protein
MSSHISLKVYAFYCIDAALWFVMSWSRAFSRGGGDSAVCQV